MATKQERPTWYPLDNAGLLYSAIQKENYSAVYRFSALMREKVDPAALQQAVDKTMPRFPGFGVRIRRGAFWCYLEPNPAPGPFVRPDMANPCQPVRFKEDNGWLIRFFYYETRISMEVFHAVSDGPGSTIFFRTLLAVYLRELGHSIPEGPGILDITQPPRKEELEDAYARYAGKKLLRGKLEKTAFPNTSPKEPFYTLNVTTGLVPVDQVRKAAKAYQATITEYLTAMLLQSILENQAQRHFKKPRPVALAIPINLRPWFPSETLRNFILTMRPCVDPTLGEYSFPELIQQVRSYMQLHASRQEMQAKLTGNVRFASSHFLQLVPLPLKNIVMAYSYQLVGVRPYSGTYTNPGPFQVPPAMAPHIQRMEAMLGQATRPSPHCTSISYGNTMAITFTNTGTSSETERRFFTHLVQEGIPVKIESNRTH